MANSVVCRVSKITKQRRAVKIRDKVDEFSTVSTNLASAASGKYSKRKQGSGLAESSVLLSLMGDASELAGLPLLPGAIPKWNGRFFIHRSNTGMRENTKQRSTKLENEQITKEGKLFAKATNNSEITDEEERYIEFRGCAKS
uniref:Uncharacterized protein n=1 Tax=Romanomermis culicivorax TaxID=13658 RepID=A0A915KH77_ROMCU